MANRDMLTSGYGWLGPAEPKPLRLLAWKAASALLLFILTVLSGCGLARVAYDDEPRSIFERNDEDFAFLRRMHSDFGADDNDVLLVIQGDELFTPRAQEGLREIVRRTAAIEGIDSVLSVYDVRRIGSNVVPLVPAADASPERLTAARERALVHPLVAGQLLSSDGETMLVVARLQGDELSVSSIESVLKPLRARVQAAAAECGLTVWLTGHPPARVESLAGLRRQLFRSLSLSALVSAVIALAVFRRSMAVVLTVVGPALGVLWTVGLMGWWGEKINGLNSVIPTILFAIGFTDSVHMMIEYRHCRATEPSRLIAAERVAQHIGVPCLFTALTTAAGFASLFFAQTPSVHRFGIWSALGTLISFAAAILAFPLAGSFPLADRALAPLQDHVVSHRWLGRMLVGLVRWPRAGVFVGFVACLVMARSPFQLSPDIRWDEALERDSETRLAMEHCDEVFGGALLAYVVVEWPPRQDINRPEVLGLLKNIHQCVEEIPEFRGPFSILDVLACLPGQRPFDLTDRVKQLSRVPPNWTRRLLRRDLRRLVVTFHTPNIGAAALLPKVSALQIQLDALARPGFRLQVTGTSVVAARNVSTIVSDLGNSLGVETVTVFCLMTLGLRSVSLGILSMIPNLLPLLVATSILIWTGQPLTVTSALAFNLCLGLAVDDTIHFLVRFKRELIADGDAVGALSRTFQHIGTAVVTTTLILMGGFATLLLSPLPAVRIFASLSCATLLAALCTDLFLLPTMLACFYRRKLPPKASDKIGAVHGTNSAKE